MFRIPLFFTQNRRAAAVPEVSSEAPSASAGSRTIAEGASVESKQGVDRRVLSRGMEHLFARVKSLSPGRCGNAELQLPLRIDGSILIVRNPVANNGKARGVAEAMRQLIETSSAAGMLEIDGRVEEVQTEADPKQRVEELASRIEDLYMSEAGSQLTVLAVGGDRTVDDVARAVRLIQEKYRHFMIGPEIVIAAGPGGTANDLRRMTGLPTDIPALLTRIAEGQHAPLYPVDLECRFEDGHVQQETTIHAATWGVSGSLIQQLERRKRQDQVSVLDYVMLLPETVRSVRPIHVEIALNGKAVVGREVVSGEIFGPMVTHKLGSVTNLPMPACGARVFLPRTPPIGAISLTEVLMRGTLVRMGFQRFIDPEGTIWTMERHRHIDIAPGDEIRMTFVDAAGKPQGLMGTLSGDSFGPVREITARLSEEPLTFLTQPHSDLMVQQGVQKPSYPGKRLIATSRSFFQLQSGRWSPRSQLQSGALLMTNLAVTGAFGLQATAMAPLMGSGPFF